MNVELETRSVVHNMDCMEGMKQYPDKYFDLAIVDKINMIWLMQRRKDLILSNHN